MCIWTNTKPSLIVWETPQSPKAQNQNVRRAFLQLSCTFCLKLSAIRSQKFFYPSAVWIQTQDTLVHDSFLPVGSLQSSAPACPPPPPPPPPTPPQTPTLTPRMNVLLECFSCFTVVKRARVRVSAGSWRDGGWGERERVCVHVRQREGHRERGEVRACVF